MAELSAKTFWWNAQSWPSGMRVIVKRADSIPEGWTLVGPSHASDEIVIVKD